MNEAQNNIQVAIADGDHEAVKAKLEEAGVEVINVRANQLGRSFTQKMAIAAAMASASSAFFPSGINDGGLGTALRRGRRHRRVVIDTTAREINNVEIARHNAEVDRKKAEKRRAKEARRREEALLHAASWSARHAQG